MSSKATTAPTVSLAAMMPLLLSMPVASCLAGERFIAKLQPLNSARIGTAATGTATLDIANGKLSVSIDMAGLAPGIMHLQHFHGFPDGREAACPTEDADTNGDGYVDLLETEPIAGTTMVPFHGHPATLEIPSDSYPVADQQGNASYKKIESVADLKNALKNKFKVPVLALEKRVIFVHGIASSTVLPDSVKSLPGVPAQATLPIACGKIEILK